MDNRAEYCVVVTVKELLSGAKHLEKYEKTASSAELTFENEESIVSMEETWAIGTLARKPSPDGTITLRAYQVACRIGPPAGEAENGSHQRIEDAARKLAHLLVSREQIAQLVSRALPKTADFWSGGDSAAIPLVAEVWKILAPLGVDACEIKRMLNRASREAFAGKKTGPAD